MQETNCIMGLWKFADKVTVEQLGEIAEKWAKEDQNYLQLYVRKASKDQYGLGFTYRVAEGADRKEAQDKYLYDTSDVLKRTFGNDLVGWDIACPVWIVKDDNIKQ